MPWAAVAVALTPAALMLSGCGADRFANERRPPAPITVSAAITPGRVTVSPSRFAAGAIELIASNQTGTSQRLRLHSEARAGATQEIDQSTGPINPGDTASLKAELTAGAYLVTARSASIAGARIVVRPGSGNAGDGLLQP